MPLTPPPAAVPLPAALPDTTQSLRVRSPRLAIPPPAPLAAPSSTVTPEMLTVADTSSTSTRLSPLRYILVGPGPSMVRFLVTAMVSDSVMGEPDGQVTEKVMVAPAGAEATVAARDPLPEPLQFCTVALEAKAGEAPVTATTPAMDRTVARATAPCSGARRPVTLDLRTVANRFITPLPRRIPAPASRSPDGPSADVSSRDAPSLCDGGTGPAPPDPIDWLIISG